jgi:hypothetical protein
MESDQRHGEDQCDSPHQIDADRKLTLIMHSFMMALLSSLKVSFGVVEDKLASCSIWGVMIYIIRTDDPDPRSSMQVPQLQLTHLAMPILVIQSVKPLILISQ